MRPAQHSRGIAGNGESRGWTQLIMQRSTMLAVIVRVMSGQLLTEGLPFQLSSGDGAGLMARGTHR
jgi:hypothetical protein